MKELLAQTNASYFLDQVHDAVIATDLEGVIQLWNRGAERIYGYTASEILGQPVSRLYFDEDAGALEREVFQPLKGNDLHRVEIRNRRKDGTAIYIDLRVCVVRNPAGNRIGYSGCSNDITERKKAEAALAAAREELEQRVSDRTRELRMEVAERTRMAGELRSSRERLRYIMTNVPGVLYTCAADTFAATFASGKVEQVLGYSAAEFLTDHRTWIDRIHPEDRGQVLGLAGHIQDSGGFSGEYRVQHRDGLYRWVRDDAMLIRDSEGRATEIVGFLQDITAIRQAQEERREQERLELLAQQLLKTQEQERMRLARDLHDNLNQQLATIILDFAHLESALAQGQTTLRRRAGRLRKRLAAVSEDVDRMARRLHPATLEQFGLEATLKSDCRALARSAGIAVSFRCEGMPAGIDKDAELCLYRVAQECFSNIRRHARADRATVTLSGTAGGISLVIADSGVGFNPSELPRKRLGLLSMAERVRLASGTLTINSAIGRGTRIEAYVPVREASRGEGAHIAGR